MRLVTGAVFAAQAVALLRDGPSVAAGVGLLAAASGACVIAGIWTPIAGTLVAAIGLWWVFTRPGDPLPYLLLATMGGTLAMVGPGALSIDARLFGWKRIDVGEWRR
jgi:hypothetical protein